MTVVTATTATSKLGAGTAASLAHRRLALISQREAQAARLASLSVTVHQMPYQASDRQILTAQLAGTRQLVAEVEAALLRVSRGTYGMCSVCGAVIPADLLQAIPLARLCPSCQHDEHR